MKDRPSKLIIFMHVCFIVELYCNLYVNNVIICYSELLLVGWSENNKDVNSSFVITEAARDRNRSLVYHFMRSLTSLEVADLVVLGLCYWPLLGEAECSCSRLFSVYYCSSCIYRPTPLDPDISYSPITDLFPYPGHFPLEDNSPSFLHGVGHFPLPPPSSASLQHKAIYR